MIGIVGCGIIGASWAAVHLAHGQDVLAYDAGLDTEVLEARILGILHDSGLTAQGKLRVASSLSDFATDVSYVQESIAEDLAVKQALFAQLDAICPMDVILASSSSALPASVIGAGLSGQGRIIIAHPAAPPHAMPAVEVVPSPATLPQVTDRTWALMQAVGQKPVLVQREVPGFAMNRMQAVLLFAMLDMIAEGIVTPEGADTIIRESFGQRWALMGPLEGVHLNAPGGIADYFTRYKPMFAGFCGPDQSIDDLLNPQVLAALDAYGQSTCGLDHIPDRQAWRNRNLIELKAWRKDRAWTNPPTQRNADAGTLG